MTKSTERNSAMRKRNGLISTITFKADEAHIYEAWKAAVAKFGGPKAAIIGLLESAGK